MIKLLSTDFDGTLVRYDQQPAVSPALFELLAELRKNGVLWAINTGRALDHITQGLEEFQFPLQPDFVLTNEREVFRRTTPGTGWEAYGDWNERCIRLHDQIMEEARPILEEINDYLKTQTNAHPVINDLYGLDLVASTNEEMEQIAAYFDSLKHRLPAFQYQRGYDRIMKFCHSAYSKGTALAELGRLLDISRDDIFACGDSYNDLSILDGCYARWPACPSNSDAAVKEAVTKADGYVANASYSDGVVESLRHYFNMERP